MKYALAIFLTIHSLTGRELSGGTEQVKPAAAAQTIKTDKPRKTQSFGKVKSGAALVTGYKFDPASTNGGFPATECFVCNVPGPGTNSWKMVRIRTDVPISYPGAVSEITGLRWPSYVKGCREVGSPVQFVFIRE